MMSAAAASGLGTDNCISVPCNEKGQMIPEELERLVHKSISDGKIPFMVTATAGTTVFGAFDPINPIADICEKHHLWLHIDAAWGGGLLMSEKFRYKFEGITRADSVTWNPHKMMNVLLQCSTVHFKQNVSFLIVHFLLAGEIVRDICFLAEFVVSLQPDVRRLLVPAGQTLRRHLRYGRQSHPVWSSQ